MPTCGGLSGLYRLGLELTGTRPRLTAVGFPWKPVDRMGVFSAREEVEALLRKLQAFEQDGVERFPLTETWGHGRPIAAGLSLSLSFDSPLPTGTRNV